LKPIVAPAVILLMAAVVLFLIANFWNTRARERPHETDDGYMRAATRLSTEVGGLAAAIAVSDYQPLRTGPPLIATIRTNAAGLMPELPG
jgi:multidrug resistance efflux pump